MDELNKMALDQFVYQPVSREMITYLADAAHNVISCDPELMPAKPEDVQSQKDQQDLPPTPPPENGEGGKAGVLVAEGDLPTVEEFITQLVVSSNVQVPTLMSTLVYLTRLKAKLQPMARGLRCTTHRIFLAALILSAKYLNDSSPKNKHWARYTNINTESFCFGFSRTEVNLMEKQLLFLLEWDLRISEHDLYRELDFFLEPLRRKIAESHAKRMRHREEKRRQQEIYAAATRYPSPPSSRAHSRTRHGSPDYLRAMRSGSITPPGLTYSSSASSYASSIASSSRQQSRSTTPLESETSEPVVFEANPRDSLYDSPIEILHGKELPAKPPVAATRMLPYEISPQQYQQLQDGAAKKRHRRGMWSRLLGGTVAVR